MWLVSGGVGEGEEQDEERGHKRGDRVQREEKGQTRGENIRDPPLWRPLMQLQRIDMYRLVLEQSLWQTASKLQYVKEGSWPAYPPVMLP